MLFFKAIWGIIVLISIIMSTGNNDEKYDSKFGGKYF
jgi:hypothetical protein